MNSNNNNDTTSTTNKINESLLQKYRRTIRILKQKQATALAATNERNGCNNFDEDVDNEGRKKNNSQKLIVDIAIQIADVYRRMGSIHYKQGRYEIARIVFQYGI